MTRYVCFDLETSVTKRGNSLSAVAYAGDVIYSMAWRDSLGNHDARVTEHFGAGSIEQVLPEKHLDLFWDLHEDDVIVGHNLTFDIVFYEARVGHSLRDCGYFDTMVAASLLDENQFMRLDAVAERYLPNQPALRKLDVARTKLKTLPVETVLEYNARDVEVTLALVPVLKQQLEERGLWGLFQRRMRLLRIACDMTHQGIRIDLARWGHLKREAFQKVAEAETHLLELADADDFNPRSPLQVGQVLYKKEWGLKPVGRTSTGQPAVGRPVLDHWAYSLDEQHPAGQFVRALLEYRRWAKMTTTYIAPLKRYRSNDGKIHPTFHISKGASRWASTEHGTVTGRWSSSDPNIQNQDKKSGLVRQIFIPDPGHYFCEADYAQIEVRVAAWLSQDPNLLSVIKDGRDYHNLTLSTVEGVSYEEVVDRVGTGEWEPKRDMVKRVNFGMLYRIGLKSLRQQIFETSGNLLSIGQIKKLQRSWRKTYLGYMAWEAWLHDTAMANGYVTSPFGVVRRRPENSFPDRWKRQAANHMVQSTAGDLLYLALENLASVERINLCATVHDSVLFEYRRDMEDSAVKDIVQRCMVDDVMDLMREHKFPNLDDLVLAVDCEAGKDRWTEYAEEQID